MPVKCKQCLSYNTRRLQICPCTCLHNEMRKPVLLPAKWKCSGKNLPLLLKNVSRIIFLLSRENIGEWLLISQSASKGYSTLLDSSELWEWLEDVGEVSDVAASNYDVSLGKLQHSMLTIWRGNTADKTES